MTKKTGKTYGAGVLLAAAKKTTKISMSANERNPKRTSLADWWCPCFHSLYCVRLGHRTALIKECGVRGKQKEERGRIPSDIMEGVMQVPLAEAKRNFRYFIYIFNFVEVYKINSL